MRYIIIFFNIQIQLYFSYDVSEWIKYVLSTRTDSFDHFLLSNVITFMQVTWGVVYFSVVLENELYMTQFGNIDLIIGNFQLENIF